MLVSSVRLFRFSYLQSVSLCYYCTEERKVQIRHCRQTDSWRQQGGRCSGPGGWRDGLPGCLSWDLPELGPVGLAKLGCWAAAAGKEVAPCAGFIFERPEKSLTFFPPSLNRNRSRTWTEVPRASNPSLRELRVAGCAGLLAQRCGLPSHSPETARRLPVPWTPNPSKCGVAGGSPACGLQARCSRFSAAALAGCLCFCAFFPPKRPWAARQPPGRGSKRQRWQPRVSTCAVLARCAQTKQPWRVPRAAVLGSSRTDKAPSGTRDALRAPAAWHRMPACRSKEHHHPATACVTYHMEDGGWREDGGGRLEAGGWRAGRRCFESNACFVLR